MTPRDPYSCPRCGYTTTKKTHIRYHLYDTKKACPAILKDIELTESIKEHILKNRIYHIPVVPPPPTITQTINNFQTMNNFIANMDPIEKIKHVTDYCRVEITDFEDRIVNDYAREIECLESSRPHDGKLDFMTIVDKLTKAIRGEQRNEFFEEISVVYDTKRKRIKVYSGGWEDYLVTNGLKHLIQTIVEYYLEKYEIYLIRKLSQSGISLYDNTTYMDSIKEYYRFLAAFELHPFCRGKTDDQLLSDSDADENDYQEKEEDTDRIVQRFETIYQTEYNNLPNGQRKTMHKNVLDIIKTNSKWNIAQLDKDIISLINMNSEFHQTIIGIIGEHQKC